MKGRAGRGSCLIVLGGAVPAPALVRQAAKECREIICADGAIARARSLGLRPRFVVGDMDSLPGLLPVRRGPAGPEPIFWCDFDPERSDFQKCLDFAAQRGFARAYVAGALGGRLDHAAVNLALAEQASAPLEVVLLDQGVARVLGPGTYRLKLKPGALFSLLPLIEARVDLSGCAYPLKDAQLKRGSRGLSNQARGKETRLSIRRGRLWLFSDFS